MSPSDQESRDRLTRRQFVRAAGATGALALSQAGQVIAADGDAPAPAAKGPDTKLPTRPLGKTGLKVSVLCYGSYNLSNPKLLETAMREGMTFVVTSADYQNGAAEKAIGEVMATQRKKVVLGTGKSCTPRSKAADLAREIDRSLKRLQTDYIDLWRVHYCSDPKVLDNDAIYEAFDQAKKAGKVGHLGVSTHTSPVTGKIVETAIAKKKFGFVMSKFNFMEFPENYEPYSNAAKAGLGVVVFKVDAGRRDKASKEMKDLQSKLKISAEQAKIKWALKNPNIASVVSGERSFEGIRDACNAAMGPLSRAEQRYLDAYAARFQKDYCRYCGACLAACPHGVKVDDVMRFAMYFKFYGAEKAAMLDYSALAAEMRASRCATCDGPCMAACPHGVSVQPQLAEAHAMLSFDLGSDRHA